MDEVVDRAQNCSSFDGATASRLFATAQMRRARFSSLKVIFIFVSANDHWIRCGRARFVLSNAARKHALLVSIVVVRCAPAAFIFVLGLGLPSNACFLSRPRRFSFFVRSLPCKCPIPSPRTSIAHASLSPHSKSAHSFSCCAHSPRLRVSSFATTLSLGYPGK